MHKHAERQVAGAGALVARITRGRDVARIQLRTERGLTSVAIGPGYSARITRRDAQSAREVSIAPARDGCAYVLTDVLVRGSTVERAVSTAFVSRTQRVDR